MPNAPLRSCAEYPCPNKVASGRCAQHTKAKHQRIDARRGSSHVRGYDKAWDHLRVQAFVRDGWRCQAKDCDTPGGWEPELVRVYRESMLGVPATVTVLAILRERYNAGQRHLDADHIVPFGNRPELRLDLRNVQTLCDACHKRKSRNEMMESIGR